MILSASNRRARRLDEVIARAEASERLYRRRLVEEQDTIRTGVMPVIDVEVEVERRSERELVSA